MPYRRVNPATGEAITTFANHTDAELQSALSVANSPYKSDWSNGPIQPRLAVLSRLADLLDCRSEELARILTRDMGKRISEARSEVQLTAEIARFFATNVATFRAPAKIQTPQGDAWVEYHPPFEVGEILFEQGGTNRTLIVVLEGEIFSNRDTLEGDKMDK